MIVCFDNVIYDVLKQLLLIMMIFSVIARSFILPSLKLTDFLAPVSYLNDASVLLLMLRELFGCITAEICDF